MKVIRKGCKDPATIEAGACCPNPNRLKAAEAPKHVRTRIKEAASAKRK